MNARPERAPSLSEIEDHLAARIQELEARLHDGIDPAVDGELSRVRTALQWCRAGVYGRCAVCGGPLPDRVVLHDPADMRCGACRRVHARAEAPAAPCVMPLLSVADGVERLNESFLRTAALARDPCSD